MQHQRVSLIFVALVGFFFCATFALDVLSINEDASSKPQTFEAVKLQWESFKLKYGKKYQSIEEEQKRFGIFYQNLIDLEERKQSYGPSVQVGVTKFYDLTFEEYKQRHLHSFGPRVTPRPASRKVEVPVPTWDWSQKGAVTKVKNEEQCGATWAMAALDTLESVCKIAGYPLISLSTQQVLDCDNSLYDSGCNGGFPEGAYEYIIQAGGIESESSYPYKGQDTNCTVNPKDFVDCHMKSYINVSIGNDEQKLVQFVYSQSPFVVCIDAGQTVFYDYTGGVITGKECPQTATDHCVTVVGWVQMGGKSVWKLKNMWGTDWGVEGYVFFEMGANTCGMDTPYTIAPCVKDVC